MTYAEGPSSGGVGSDLNQQTRGTVGVGTADVGHEEVQAQLSEYLAGTLDEAEKARVAGHLRDCKTCAADLTTLRRMIDVLHTLPSHTAPDSLRQRVLAIPDTDQDAPSDSPPRD